LGNEKCLVIFGIRQSCLPDAELYLTHEDVEPITIMPVTHSNGEVVYEQLMQTAEKTGVPRQIVADYGPDIKSGIDRFCKEHRQTCSTYDIKHKNASILKRELKDDPNWVEFIKNAAQTRKKVQQTAMAALAPPNQRSKSRYMNIDVLVKWGVEKLETLDILDGNENKKEIDRIIDDKIGWLRQYRTHLYSWSDLADTLKEVQDFIKFSGLYRDCHNDLQSLDSLQPQSKRARRVCSELIEFVKEQSAHADSNERLLGSSEIIESVFGKLKSIEHDQVRSGFTSLLLSIAAMVSEITTDTIRTAIETVPTKKVREWLDSNIPNSLQSKRKKLSAIMKKQEPKRDQIISLLEG
jgi:hypothetical protein